MFEDSDCLQVKTSCVWVKYMNLPQLFELLDSFYIRNPGIKYGGSPSQDLVEGIIHAISSFTSPSHWQNEFEFASKLPQLVRLRRVLPRATLLDQVIGSAIHSSIPMGLNVLSSTSCSTSFTELIGRSRVHWARRMIHAQVSIPIDIWPFLTQDEFDDSTSTIISGLLYRHPSVCTAVLQWISSEQCLKRDIKHLLPIIYGVIGVSSVHKFNFAPVGHVLWKPLAAIIANENTLRILRLQSQHVLAALLLTSQVEMTDLLSILTQEVQATLEKAPTSELLEFATWLCSHIGSAAHEFISMLVEAGMQWSIRQLSADDTRPDLELVLQSLGKHHHLAFLIFVLDAYYV